MTKGMSSRELIRMLKDDGWYLVATEGDHWQFKHPERAGRVTIQHPRKDIDIRVLRSVYRQAGWDWKTRR